MLILYRYSLPIVPWEVLTTPGPGSIPLQAGLSQLLIDPSTIRLRLPIHLIGKNSKNGNFDFQPTVQQSGAEGLFLHTG